ncbi:MAG: hypothetical protein DMF62_00515 [Acidobacteria bacterium]|nr:MAG: hypothetical protein DMF62_00515 [Acidobacteriota bacterium]
MVATTVYGVEELVIVTILEMTHVHDVLDKLQLEMLIPVELITLIVMEVVVVTFVQVLVVQYQLTKVSIQMKW